MSNYPSNNQGKLPLAIMLTFMLAAGSGYLSQFFREHFSRAPAELPSAQPSTHIRHSNAWKIHQLAGMTITSPFAFKPANQRLDQLPHNPPADIHKKLVSYEGWESEETAEDFNVVIHRITYTQDIEPNLEGSMKDTISDIEEGLKHRCKPDYVSVPKAIAQHRGRRLSVICKIPKENPVQVEAVLFSDDQTLWQVQVGFSNPAKKADAIRILESVHLNTATISYLPSMEIQ